MALKPETHAATGSRGIDQRTGVAIILAAVAGFGVLAQALYGGDRGFLASTEGGRDDCGVEGCGQPVYFIGLCEYHWEKLGSIFQK